MEIERISSAAGPQRIRIEWREAGPLTVIFFREEAAPVRICGASSRFFGRGFNGMTRGFRAFGGRGSSRRRRSVTGFTLLELLVVLAIIGLMASLTLPHLRGFSKSNSMSASTRQLLDDIAFARQRAIANRSTVYMVFVPANPWNNISQQSLNSLPGRTFTNLIQGQYRGYALVSLRTVGDQPGQWHPSFLTDWKTLPSGVFIATNQFINSSSPSNSYFVFTTNTLSAPNNPNRFSISPFAYTINRLLPFPTLQSYTTNLPYIAFSPNGSLVDENGNLVPDQFISLTSGGILYPSDDNGPLFQTPLIAESPLGESTNNANLIHIDATTARAKVERNQF